MALAGAGIRAVRCRRTKVTSTRCRLTGTSTSMTAGGGGKSPRDVYLSADPSGQHLLLTYGSRDGFRTGWISQGRLRPLPVRQPYPGPPVTAW
jgi:hypothetical protein